MGSSHRESGFTKSLQGIIQSPLMADPVHLLPYVWGFLFNKSTEWRGSRVMKDPEHETCVDVLHKMFPTQELMLSEDVTVI